jgi:hypothetical protein
VARYELLEPGQDPTRQVNEYPRPNLGLTLAIIVGVFICSGLLAAFVFIPRSSTTGAPAASPTGPTLTPSITPSPTSELVEYPVTVVVIVTPGPTPRAVPVEQTVVMTATPTFTPTASPSPTGTATP